MPVYLKQVQRSFAWRLRMTSEKPFSTVSNNKLYIGHTNNLGRRELEHKFHHEGAKFIRDNSKDFKIVYREKFYSRADAVKRERQLKGWTRVKKEALIARDLELLKKL